MSNGDSSKSRSKGGAPSKSPPRSSSAVQAGGRHVNPPPPAGSNAWAGGGGKRIVEQSRPSNPPYRDPSNPPYRDPAAKPSPAEKPEKPSLLSSCLSSIVSFFTFLFCCSSGTSSSSSPSPSSSSSTSRPVTPPDYSTFAVSGGHPSVDWAAASACRASASAAHGRMTSLKSLSQSAYVSGNKASAHELSVEGKAWGSKMDAENEKAVALIFGAQNWRTERTVDLHGLFVEEAREAVSVVLDFFAMCPPPVDFIVVTGAGHHSSNHQPLIRPMVEKELRVRGYRFEAVHGDGAFHVTIGGGKPSNSYI